MISDNIKNLRKEKGLTQKELADLLHVTAQAVSRWEKGEVEPSVDTISNMAKIFEVTTDEIIVGPEKKPQETIAEVQEKIVVEQGKPVLTICAQCKRPIYESDEIVTTTIQHEDAQPTTGYICIDCDNKNKEEKMNERVSYGESQRNKSFIWSGIISGLILLFGILGIAGLNKVDAGGIGIVIVLAILTFTFASCVFLKNNWVGETFDTIASWGFVTFPGVIFEFSFEGIIWLIGIKILFGLLGLIIGFLAVILALVICLPLSLIEYPFALIKSINKPELTEND